MALRVLPSLSLAVTEDAVRKQKRLVMFVPGLVAFAVYRAAKHVVPLTEPVLLLLLSGTVGVLTAMLAYGVGRGTRWSQLLREDGRSLLTWIAGWIGFVYAVQLSLLVLALLWLVGYDYLKHPDGPAMMAIIISCTAVARDAFEIGHVRKVSLMGWPCPTFPNGLGLRSLLTGRAAVVGPWMAVGLIVGACAGLRGHGGRRGAGTLRLLRRLETVGLLDARNDANKGDRAAQVLVVAGLGIRLDLLSGCGRCRALSVEAARRSDFLCDRRRRSSGWLDGIVWLLPRSSSAGRRGAGRQS